MPMLKIDHVVSFSSEDAVYTASNILTNKKWKCEKAGEKQGILVLQLEKASVITGIDIGNEHSAYIEVVVTRSGTNDSYKPLLVMSSFMSPLESRQSTNSNKVRMFTQNELSKPECEQKWDRIKIICTQPFNRHVQFGLSFIKFHTLKETSRDLAVEGGGTGEKIGRFNIRPESPNIFKNGSIFETRNSGKDEMKGAAAIRDASTNQTRKPVYKGKQLITQTATPKREKPINEEENNTPRERDRTRLLYADDDDKPNDKIDKVVEQKKAEDLEKKTKKEDEDKLKIKIKKEKEQKRESDSKKESSSKQTPLNITITKNRDKVEEPSTSKRKLIDSSSAETPKKKTKITKPFNKLFENVLLVISGIQNPDRSELRSKALEMGAKYKGDWDSSCTHLICAFVKTPKFNQVKGKGKIITRKWIEESYAQRKRLPWRRFALDRNDQGPESEEEIYEERDTKKEDRFKKKLSSDDDLELHSDTEERIKKIQENMKQKGANGLTNGGTKNIFEVDTDDEPEPNIKINKGVDNLPNLFETKKFYIDQTLDPKNQKLLEQYIVAYNGMVTNDPTESINYLVTDHNNAECMKNLNTECIIVNCNWIWKCHNKLKLVDITDFLL